MRPTPFRDESALGGVSHETPGAIVAADVDTKENRP
jgi:hypothetical protein